MRKLRADPAEIVPHPAQDALDLRVAVDAAGNVNLAKRDAQGSLIIADSLSLLWKEYLIDSGVWDGVFFDMGGSEATIWFNGGDCQQALGVFENALKRAYPATKYLGESANPNDATLRSRAYQIELGEDRVAVVDVAYPGSAAGKRQFAVRVFAQKRTR